VNKKQKANSEYFQHVHADVERVMMLKLNFHPATSQTKLILIDGNL